MSNKTPDRSIGPGVLTPDAAVPAKVLAAFAETAGHLYASEDLDETLRRITAVALELITPCAMASVSVMTVAGLATHAETNARALEADLLQYDVGEGPCLDALEEHHIAYAPDTSTDDRWPAFTHRLADLGIASLLACGFRSSSNPSRVIGALNLYGTAPRAFGDEEVSLAVLLGVHAGAVVDASLQQSNLRRAIESRDVIGQAKGILMERLKVTADEAFDRLRLSSQALNVRVRDLADRLTRTGELPTLVGARSRDGERPANQP